MGGRRMPGLESWRQASLDWQDEGFEEKLQHSPAEARSFYQQLFAGKCEDFTDDADGFRAEDFE